MYVCMYVCFRNSLDQGGILTVLKSLFSIIKEKVAINVKLLITKLFHVSAAVSIHSCFFP